MAGKKDLPHLLVVSRCGESQSGIERSQLSAEGEQNVVRTVERTPPCFLGVPMLPWEADRTMLCRRAAYTPMRRAEMHIVGHRWYALELKQTYSIDCRRNGWRRTGPGPQRNVDSLWGSTTT